MVPLAVLEVRRSSPEAADFRRGRRAGAPPGRRETETERDVLPATTPWFALVAITPMPDSPSGRIPVDIWDTLMEALQRADAESAIVRAATKPAAITSSAPAQ